MALNSRQKMVRRSLVAGIAALTCIALAVEAQMPDPNAQMQPPPQMQPAAPQKTSFKQMFAGTVAAVLTATGAGVAAGLTTAMSGAIQNWFNKPGRQPSAAAAGMGGMPGAMPGQMPGGMPGTGMPDNSMGGMTAAGAMPGAMGSPMPAAGMPGMGMPADGTQPQPGMGMPAPGMPPASGMPGTGMPDNGMGATAGYSAMPGMQGMPPPPGMGMPGAPAPAAAGMPGAPAAAGVPGPATPGMGMPSGTPSLYAGLAFEVHALSRTGESVPVDPATYSFASGDRFVVMYRPSLPGQVAIYNVNPLGQEKKIDAVNVAAGELTRLGPYEFRDNVGREVLRLILTPCRSAQLIATTRDIVKVEDTPSTAAAASPVPGALGLPDCSVVASREVRPQTRDIVKVGAEEGTMFALDQVSQQEIQAGSITPRELTLTFNHR
jgi:hypothetical protein